MTSTPTPRDEPQPATSPLLWALAGYCALIVWGTLYPAEGWRIPPGFYWRTLLLWPSTASLSDVATNVILYIPVGVLLTWRRRHARTARALMTAALLGGALSYSLECLQLFLPARVPSRIDVVTNTLGAVLGAGFALLTSERAPLGRRLRALRATWFLPGRLANVGLLALGLWTLSQWAPLVPSLDFGDLKDGIRPLWNTLHDLGTFDLLHALEYTTTVLALGLMASTLTRTRLAAGVLTLLAVPTVLAIKVLVLTRTLSLEAVVGAGAGLVALLFVLRTVPRAPAAALALVAAVALAGLRPLPGSEATAFHAINWIPFADYRLNLFDLPDLFGTTWPFVALAYLTRLLAGPPRTRALPTALLGGALVVAATLGIELAQQTLPGRTPDITDALLATAAWFGTWALMATDRAPDKPPNEPAPELAP